MAETHDNEHEGEIEDVIKRIQDPKTGLEIKDRKWLLKTYKHCFVGRDMVNWLLTEKVAATRGDAVTFGQELLEAGMIQHVTRDHAFKDEPLYYKVVPKDKRSKTGGNWKNYVAKLLQDDSVSEGGDHVQPSIPRRDGDSDQSPDPTKLEVFPLDKWNVELLNNVHPPMWEDPDPRDVYNMVVIGAGTAGLITAAGTAGLGGRVAIIEKHLMGGDCLNVGCVPSKALIRCATAIHEARSGDKFGFKVKGEIEVDFPAIMERMRRLRSSISHVDGAERFSKDLGIDVFIGEGKFTSKSTVMVNGKTLKFAKACIATGSKASIPPITGLDKVPFLTNATLFNLTELPKTLAVIGTGAIGCEMAQSFVRFGSEVHMFARSPHILSREDPEAALVIEKQLISDGIIFHPSVTYSNIEKTKDDKIEITVVKNGITEKIVVTHLLVSTGRTPNLKSLDLESAGVKYTKRGVKVSDQLVTSNPNIFAAGDCCSQYKFTHMADFLARIVIRNALFFGSSKVSDLVVPWATFTEPEIAHVGAYERDLTAKKIKYREFKISMDDIDRAILEDETEGFVKVYVKEGTDKILGATIVAGNAGDMISEITLAMVNKIGLLAIAPVIHPYPTQAEAIRKLGDQYNKTRLTTFNKVFLRKILAVRR